MEYIGGLLGGIAGSAAFWVIDKYLAVVSQDYRVVAAIGFFIVFGVVGYLFARKSKTARGKAGFSVASGWKGKKITGTIEEIQVPRNVDAQIASNIKAKNDIEINIKNIKS
ncbi:hypothetical protein KDX16_21010 [Burkholderia vietnamiensis]|uniref:hypothetical protein n=1 Tax=Burkholderia vietnamiensis TaxID=60552 RepID=UPI001BA082CA|nr:hypothetical protein [Burkholderia vietnamiensis]MBR7918269.1 hypothetical protein [Burkholderia vietnamiensis]